MDYKITLQAARTNARLTQAQMADKMGVSLQTIQRWEAKNNIPKLADFKHFCEICHAPEDIIFLR